jgi:hypothetical protein
MAFVQTLTSKKKLLSFQGPSLTQKNCLNHLLNSSAKGNLEDFFFFFFFFFAKLKQDSLRDTSRFYLFEKYFSITFLLGGTHFQTNDRLKQGIFYKFKKIKNKNRNLTLSIV